MRLVEIIKRRVPRLAFAQIAIQSFVAAWFCVTVRDHAQIGKLEKEVAEARRTIGAMQAEILSLTAEPWAKKP